MNGLTGKECNYKDPLFPFLGKVCILPNASDCSAYDPSHDHESTTERIFGCRYGTNIE